MSAPKDKADKSAQAWQSFLGMLTPSAKCEVQRLEPKSPLSPAPPVSDFTDEETDQYHAFRKTLTGLATGQLDDIAGPDEADEAVEPNEKLARYCLIECPDGDWSMVRMFKTPDGLARRIGQLEGEDMVVWAMFGIPLRITKGPQRYLLLPDGMTALTIPVVVGGPVKEVEADLLDQLELQDDGYLGPPELAQAHTIAQEQKSSTAPAKGGKKKTKQPEDDYTDDDDDDVPA